MLSQRVANLIFVAIIIVACGYFAWVAEGFTTSGLLAGAGLPSKFFPHLVLGFTALCALITGYNSLVRGATGGDGEKMIFASTREARQGLLMLVVTVACDVIWRHFGFLPMAIMLGPLGLLAMGVFKPLIYVVVLALTAGITLVFTFGLGARLL